MKKAQTDQPTTNDERPASASKRKRKTGPEKYHIYHDPKEADGESTFVVSLAANKDPELFIERSEDCDPGETFLIVRARADGARIESWRYTKEDAPETTISLRDEEERRARGRDAFVEDDETLESLDEDRIVKLVASTVNATLDARERAQRADKDQPSALDMMREVEELTEKRTAREREMRAALIEEVRGMVQPHETDQAQAATDIVNSALNIVNTLREASDELNPPQERAGKVGVIGQFASLIDSLGRHGPKIIPMAKMALGGVIPQQQQPAPVVQRAPVAQVQPEAAAVDYEETEPPQPLTVEKWLENIVRDIQNEDGPDDAVGELVRLVSENESLIPMASQLVQNSNDELLALLYQCSGANLSLLTNADKYLNDLRKGVRKRIKLSPVASVMPATNGNGAHAAEVKAS
jgi:hypothetical protein